MDREKPIVEMPSVEKLLEPISLESATGEDARYEFSYELMEAETKKFGSLFGEVVDWSVVEQHAQIVVLQHSKDLKAACYLIRAWFESAGLQGLNRGLHLLAQLLESFGADLYPKRRRGRDGAVEWLVRQMELALPNYQLKNGEIELIQPLAALSQDITFKLSECFPDTEVSLFTLRDELHRLSNSVDVTALAQKEADSRRTQPPAQNAPVSNTDNHVGVEESPVPEPELAAEVVPEPVPEVKPVVSPSAPVVEAVPSVNAGVKQNKPKPVELPTDFTKPQLARRTLEKVAEYLLSADPGHPLVYAIYRYITWNDVTELPPADKDGLTQLMLPISGDVCAEYEAAAGIDREGQKALSVKLERSLSNAPFWLTGQRLQYDILTALDEEEAAKSVQTETIRFVTSLPGIEHLKFSDGQPFADEMTQTWLSQPFLTSPAGLQGGGVGMDDVGFDVEHLDPDNIGSVMFSVADKLRTAGSGREKFLIHLRLAQLLQDAELYELCWPHLEIIWPAREALDLASWEPQLCMQLDQLVLSSIKKSFKQDDLAPDKYQKWLRVIGQ